MLRIVTPWDSQPQEAVGVDWGNPLAQGLQRLVTFNSGPPYDLVTGNFLTPRGSVRTPGVVTAKGVGNSTGDVNSYWEVPLRNEASPQSFSMAWVGLRKSGAANAILLRDSTTVGGSIPLWSNAGFDLRLGGTDYAAAGTFNAGQVYSTVVTGSTTAGKVFVDGAPVINGGAPGSTAFVSPWTLHQNGGNSGQAAEATTILFAIWDRPLSDAEALGYSANPWQLFAPRSIWVPVSAGGGSDGNASAAPANATLTAPTATGSGSAQASTAPAGSTLTAPTATASASAQASGALAGASLTAPEATATGTTAGNGTGTGTLAGLTLTAPEATATGTAADGYASGEIAGMSLAAPTATASNGETTRRHAGGYKLRKGYLIKGRRYFLSEDELAVHIAHMLQEVSRGEVKEITAGKPKVISKRAWDAIKPMERLNALSDMLATKVIAKPDTRAEMLAQLMVEIDDEESLLMLM